MNKGAFVSFSPLFLLLLENTIHRVSGCIGFSESYLPVFEASASSRLASFQSLSTVLRAFVLHLSGG